jgi:hypothetical protein
MYTAFPPHFCKRLFPRLEPMTSWSQGNQKKTFCVAIQANYHDHHIQ